MSTLLARQSVAVGFWRFLDDTRRVLLNLLLLASLVGLLVWALRPGPPTLEDKTALVLLLDDFAGASLPALREFTAALDRFKAAGKPVFAWAPGCGQ